MISSVLEKDWNITILFCDSFLENAVFDNVISCINFSFFNAIAKTREKLYLKTRSVPGSCLKFEYQRTFSLHEPRVLEILPPRF